LQGGEKVTGKKMFRFFSALMVTLMLTIALAACGDPTATTAPTTTAATTAAATTTARPATTTAAATTAAATTAAATTTAAPATTAAATTAAGTTAAAALPITGKITFWHAYGSGGSGIGEPAALAKALEQFKKDYPNVTVEALDVPFDQIFNKFKTEAAAGGGPDLFIAPNDSLGDLARANLLANLDDALKGKLENVLPVAVEGSKVDGKLYLVPESLKAVAMFYNKDKVATPPKTAQEMLDAQKSGKAKFAFNNGIYHQFGWSGAFGGKLMDTTGKCVADQGGFSDALKFLQDMKAAGAQLLSDGEKAAVTFTTGAADAIIEGPWRTADFKKAYGDKLAVAPIPAGAKGPANPLTGVDGWHINANLKGDKLNNVANFALYMTSPKIEQLFVDVGHVPADKTLKISDPITQGFATAVATGLPRPQNKELSAFWENFGNGLAGATDKGVDSVKAIADACSAMNKANGK
jgi:arabinogalactan oligomer/maltooligosaccharide transport system substrate-binding protein